MPPPVAALSAEPEVVPPVAVVPVTAPLDVLLVVPVGVPPVVSVGTRPGRLGTEAVSEGTCPGSAGTLGRVTPVEPTGGVTTVVIPEASLVTAAPADAAAPTFRSVLAGAVVIAPVGEEGVPDEESPAAAGGTGRGAAVLSGITQFTSRSVQKAGMLVRSVESAASADVPIVASAAATPSAGK